MGNARIGALLVPHKTKALALRSFLLYNIRVMGHINDFKKGEDYIGLTVVYFCHDGKGKILMAKRSSNSRDEQGKWDISGGGIEFGDTPEQTLRKEVMEEYCTNVLDFEFLGIRDVQRINGDKKTHWVALDFKALADPSIVKIGEPHKFDDIGWFEINNLPEEIHSQLPIFLNKYKEKL